MGKFDGNFVLESSTNVAGKLKASGIPGDLIKKYLDPKNSVSFAITETSPGCFEMKSTISNIPEWDNTISLKMGERTEVTRGPVQYSITPTLKNDNTVSMKTEINGVVMESETVYHSYGCSHSGTVAGVSFTEEYKKVVTNISGYYYYESGTGVGEIMKWFDLPFSDENALMKNGGFRLIEKDNGLWIEELFGGTKKEFFSKFDEELDYERPEWNISDKRITTRTGPGVFKTVCKDNKKGKVWDWTSTVTPNGLTIETNAGGLKAVEYYKRGCDLSGSWRVAVCSGGDGYASALGMNKAQKEKYVDGMLNYKFQVERLPNGLIKIKSNSPWVGPGGEINIKSGEPFSFEMPEVGRIENIGYEGSDSWCQVTKSAGRTIAVKEKYSGDFVVSESTVDNIKSSTLTLIYTRD